MTRRGSTFFVTGGTGFLGRHVLGALRTLAPGARVILLLRDARAWERQAWRDEAGTVEILEGSLLDETWHGDQRLAGLTGIFHLAAEVRHSRSDVDEMFRINVEGTVNMVRLASSAGARLLFASTSGTVGGSRRPGESPDEDAPYCEDVVRGWPYYLSKIRAEQEARALAAKSGVELVIARPPVLLGPGDHRVRSTRHVLQLLRGKLPFILDGSIHFVDVRDVATALVRAMLQEQPKPAYHFPGTICSLDEFFRMVAAAAGMRPTWIKLPTRLLWTLARLNEMSGIRAHLLPNPVVIEMAASHWGLGSRHAKPDLGFVPRAAEVTIADTVNWLREQGLHRANAAESGAAERA